MSQRWRLIDGNELYDMDADPGQKSNVFDQHPQVVAKLSSWYDDLWNELEPTFSDVPEIPLGDDVAGIVALNYHDCIDRHFFWFQNGIRSLDSSRSRKNRVSMIVAAKDKRPPAFWPVNVVASGKFVIELRRWPIELDHPIRADLPAGDLVYGEKSHRSQPGLGFPAVKANLTIGDRQFSTGVISCRLRLFGENALVER